MREKSEKVSVQAPAVDIEASVDRDIESFDVWFQTLGNSPLSRPERAIIKTYLGFKLGLRKED